MTRSRELAELASAYDSGNSLGFRNRIINGDMRIDQRNNGASVGTPNAQASYFGVDRWAIFTSAANKLTLQRNAGSVAPPVGFTNYQGVTSSSAYTVAAGETIQLYHNVEGFNAADLMWGTANAQAVTVSFWVRSSLTGNFGGGVTNEAQNRSYPFLFAINAANTWEQKTLTISGDTAGAWNTTNGRGITLVFDMGTGSNFKGTASAWSGSNLYSATGATSVVGTSGATFYITGVQLEAGTVASPFERRPYGQELALCQRYYQKTGAFFAATQNGSELNAVGSCNVKVEMRANPTATLPAGARFHKPGIAFYAISSVDVGPQANGDGYQVCVIASGAGTGTVGQIDSGLILSAEL